jgi:hypothetical protein
VAELKKQFDKSERAFRATLTILQDNLN